ncbi:MAG: hypothetical protein MUC65_09505 [Pontiellaceae bacterium]|nr:hypothetical protein [Pontiellaceae bacterium]
MPRNPLLAEPLYRVKFVEKAGTGTTDMIADCLDAGLPEPTFMQNGAHFVITIWRDWLTDDVLAGLGLNERQMKAVRYVKEHGEITSGKYQELTGAEARTATRDLVDLVGKQVFTKRGEKRSAVYRLRGQ